MKTFINASSVKIKQKKEKIEQRNVEKFIDVFNKYIRKGGSFGNTTINDTFYLNDCLDGIPTLNNTEFKLAVKEAKKSGWLLEQQEDNYQTISYSMKKIVKK